MYDYIDSQGGSYQDKKWCLQYFEEFKVVGLGDTLVKKTDEVSMRLAMKTVNSK